VDESNPFRFKAHPLLSRWIDLLSGSGQLSLDEVSQLLLIALAANLAWAFALRWFLWRAERIRLSFGRAFLLALPAALVYLPLATTVCSDVLAHAFRFQDRFIVVFSLFVASQILAAFYAFAIRYSALGNPIGLAAGMALSLFMLLLSLPLSLLLLGFDACFGLF
jgi:hypothetical protein